MANRRKPERRPNPQMVVHGAVSDKLARMAQEKVHRVMHHLRDPVLFARVTLVMEPDPARERRAFAQAVLDVDGKRVQAHARGVDMQEAINRLEERLRRQLEILTEHRQELRKRGPVPREQGEWRHGYPSAHRPAFFPREAADRDVVPRWAPASRPMTSEEAVDEMELLGYDFHLFVDVTTGEDAVVSQGGDGAVSCEPLAGPSPRPVFKQSEAITLLDLCGEPFVFYRDAATGRGAVVYHRYDGHIGVLGPLPAAR